MFILVLPGGFQVSIYILFFEIFLSLTGVPGPHSRAGKENGREGKGDTMIPHVCESSLPLLFLPMVCCSSYELLCTVEDLSHMRCVQRAHARVRVL